MSEVFELHKKCRGHLFKLIITNRQKDIRTTFALKVLITETSNLSPATSLTFCINSCREIFFSCKTKGTQNTKFQQKRETSGLSKTPEAFKHSPYILCETWQ
jgi:hypothetical protein